MVGRFTACMTCFVFLALGVASAKPDAEPWQSVEIVAFTDFDNLDVKLDGKPCKAFLVGLRPFRETVKGKAEQTRLRKRILAKLRNNALSARVMTRRGDIVGLSIDTFLHHKNDFGNSWKPNEYPYCWTGWGAYNFNTYYLYTKTTQYRDNFGDNRNWQNKFAQVVCAMRGAERAAVLVKDLGHKRFAMRMAATKALKAIGKPAIGPLRKAAASGDLETQRRVELILQAITTPTAQKDQTKTVWAARAK